MHILSTNWFRGNFLNPIHVPLMIDSISQSLLVPLFPPFLYEFRPDLAIESYFLFIIELWPPEYHGAPDDRKFSHYSQLENVLLFFLLLLSLRRKYSTFHVEYSEQATSFGRFPSQTWILRCVWTFYVYVKYRIKFPSIDSNINQILHNSLGRECWCWVGVCTCESVKSQTGYFSFHPHIVACFRPHFLQWQYILNDVWFRVTFTVFEPRDFLNKHVSSKFVLSIQCTTNGFVSHLTQAYQLQRLCSASLSEE